MSDVKNKSTVADVKVEEVEDKRFNFNVESGLDKNGNKILFTFSGPEKSSLGLIYDAAHRVLMEVSAIIQKRAEDLKPKSPEEAKEEIKEEEVEVVK